MLERVGPAAVTVLLAMAPRNHGCSESVKLNFTCGPWRGARRSGQTGLDPLSNVVWHSRKAQVVNHITMTPIEFRQETGHGVR